MVEDRGGARPLLCDHNGHSHPLRCVDNPLAAFNFGFAVHLPTRSPLAFYRCVTLLEQSLTTFANDNVINPSSFAVLWRWINIFREKCNELLSCGTGGFRAPQHDEMESFKQAIPNAIPEVCQYYPWFALGNSVGLFCAYPEMLSGAWKPPASVLQLAINLLPGDCVTDIPLLAEIKDLDPDAFATGTLKTVVERYWRRPDGDSRDLAGELLFYAVFDVVTERMKELPPKQVPGKAVSRNGGRRPDPKVQERNTKLIKAYKSGTNISDLCARFGMSAASVRQTISQARKRGELPPVKKAENVK